MISRLYRIAIPLSATWILMAASASADMTKAQCVKANADAQSLRRGGKFGEAREKLMMCADPKCPALVQTDCTKRLDELEAAQPTIVFDAKDGSGHDLSAVKVTVDGRQLSDKLDGSPLQVDPGEHEFTFTVADQPPVTQKFVLSDGQRNRHERIVIGSPPPPQPQGEAPKKAPRDEAVKKDEGRGMGTQKVIALAVGGVGLAGIAAGSIFGLMASSTWSKAQSDCGGGCGPNAAAQGEKSDAQTDALVSTIGFAAGGAALAAGVVLWFTAPSSASAEGLSGRLRVTPGVGAKTGGLLVQGEF